MTTFDRRRFVQLSTGALLAAYSSELRADTHAAEISTRDDSVRVTGANYSWEYSKKNDRFRLLDSRNRLIAAATVQPALVVAPTADAAGRQCTPGTLTQHQAKDGRVTFEYGGVNGAGRLSRHMAVRYQRHLDRACRIRSIVCTGRSKPALFRRREGLGKNPFASGVLPGGAGCE